MFLGKNPKKNRNVLRQKPEKHRNVLGQQIGKMWCNAALLVALQELGRATAHLKTKN
jgi:hypothetical protein